MTGSIPFFLQLLLDSSRTINYGVPQGSPLSPTLFLLAINDLGHDFPRHVRRGKHADDIAIWLTGTSLTEIQRNLQTSLNLAAAYIEDWTMKVQPDKCKYVIFTRRHRHPNDVSLHIDGVILEEVPRHKYLGVWLDSKLTWLPHVTALEEKCQKRLNFLKAVMGLKWGASRHLGRPLFVQYIRTAMDYGALLYGVACPTHLRRLDKVQNSAMRIFLGLPKSTAIAAMEVEAQLLPLSYRRQQLELNYLATRLPKQTSQFSVALRKNLPPINRQPLEHRLQHHLWTAFGHTPPHSQDFPTMTFPLRGPAPWAPAPFTVNTDWTRHSKTELPREALRQLFLTTLAQTRDASTTLTIYTDASHDDKEPVNSIGLYVENFHLHQTKTTDGLHDIARCELLALWEAVRLSGDFPYERIVICSDSKSALAMLQHRKPDPLVHDIYATTLNSGNSYTFLWCPAHADVRGNDLADRAAKAGLRVRPQPLDIPLPPLTRTWKRLFRAHLHRKYEIAWQTSVEGRTQLDYRSGFFGPTTTLTKHLSRSAEVTLSRLHCRRLTTRVLLHRYNKIPSPDCRTCSTADSIAHILTSCRRYAAHQRTLRHLLKVQLLTLPATLRATIASDRSVIRVVLTIWTSYSSDNNLWRPPT